MTSEKVDNALVDLLAEQVKQTTFAGCVLITLVGTFIWSAFPTAQVLGWILAGYVIAIPRFLIIVWIEKKLAPGDPRTTLEWFIGTALFVSGLHWGIAGWLFLDTNDVQYFALVCGAILGVIASSLAIFSTRPLICTLFAFTVFSIVTVKLALIGNWGLVIMCLVVLPPYTLQSRTLGRRIEKSITQDFRNAELLEEVRSAKDAAEKASLEKSLFMTATSHDLRQPLHAQSMLLQILSSRAKDTELSQIVERMMISNDALIALFNALLEVSQLDAGTIEVRESHHSLLEVVTSVVGEFQESAHQKGLKMTLIGSDHTIYSDPILLMRILRNLVSNAIKFTPEGSVTLDMRKDGSLVKISVCDTGIGIPQEDQNKIFSEYTQLGNQSRDRSKGIGLGLALVRRMCELLEHDIWVNSATGKGSCFHMTVPAGDAEFIVKLDKDPVPDLVQNLDIMIIDDEQQILDAMQTLFSDWGCRTQTFLSLSEAQSAVVNLHCRPDLIISDYRLSEQSNGMNVISHLRKLLDDDVPAIIISGDTDSRLLEKIQNEGFYLLHKPVNISKLRKVISSLIGNKDRNQT